MSQMQIQFKELAKFLLGLEILLAWTANTATDKINKEMKRNVTRKFKFDIFFIYTNRVKKKKNRKENKCL